MKWMHSLVAVVVLTAGCRSLPTPYLERGTQWHKDRAELGKEYCQRVAVVADINGQKFLGVGIMLGIVATALSVAGAAMGPSPEDDPNWAEKNRNTLVLASGAALAIPTTILLMRSKNASNASGAARLGMKLKDDEAMATCLDASAELANSRANAAEYAKAEHEKNKDADAAAAADADADATPKEPTPEGPEKPPEEAPAETKAAEEAAVTTGKPAPDKRAPKR